MLRRLLTIGEALRSPWSGHYIPDNAVVQQSCTVGLYVFYIVCPVRLNPVWCGLVEHCGIIAYLCVHCFTEWHIECRSDTSEICRLQDDKNDDSNNAE